MGNAVLCRAGTILEVCVDVLFPALCYSCGRLLPAGGRVVCPECAAAMKEVEPGDPLVRLARERLCGDGAVDDVMAFFHFEKGGVLQSILHQLKYADASGIGHWLGTRIGSIMLEQESLRTIDGIIPVPLHIAKKRERGFNQSECIAAGIGRVLHAPVRAGWLRRIRHTPTQTALGVEERKANMEGAFEVPLRRQPGVRGAKILVVDDVITTGATIRSCAVALRIAGAASVIACSVGLADRTSL